MFNLVGLNNGESNADLVMKLESTLAQQHMKKEQTRDMVALYNKLSQTELAELMPNFNWTAFLQEAQLPTFDGLVVTQLDYMKSLDGIIQTTSIDDWKVFLLLLPSC